MLQFYHHGQCLLCYILHLYEIIILTIYVSSVVDFYENIFIISLLYDG